MDKKKIMNTMLQLVKKPGISGTESENLTVDKVYSLLKQIPYFNKNSNYVKKVHIKKDTLNRKFVSAFYKSKTNTKKTIILTGHTDVVGVEEFGELKKYAFDPIDYTKIIKEEVTLDEESLMDLKTGDWLFGRGVADMKFGLALEIELLRKLTKLDDLNGNILFLAVPSEESNSEGMLEAVSYLVEMKEKYGLIYEGVLLPEPFMYSDDNDNKYIHLGSCGKIMPMVFFAGKETHVGAPFSGLSSNLMASEFNRLFEMNTEFCDFDEEITPPPMCLKLKDLKELYSVQTPLFTVAYYNMITLNNESKIDKIKEISKKAFENCLEIVNESYSNYSKYTLVKENKLKAKSCVKTFSELYKEVKKIKGKEIDNLLMKKFRSGEIVERIIKLLQ
ncbi:MAG: M20/M25/M40 family metallo-hydrolase [Firmicutes bacterium]|nr:M20/M25/M40 family metallo-hydrolase [Bacillota bacterium]